MGLCEPSLGVLGRFIVDVVLEAATAGRRDIHS
jgi:hypothetical protein